MGEEKSRDIADITVRYSDGSTKEIQSGCCVDLEKGSDDLSVEMLNVKPFDLVRLAYGLVAAVQTVTSLVFWCHISRAAEREHCRAFWMLAAFVALRVWSTCRSWQRKLPDPERGKDGKQKL